MSYQISSAKSKINIGILQVFFGIIKFNLYLNDEIKFNIKKNTLPGIISSERVRE